MTTPQPHRHTSRGDGGGAVDPDQIHNVVYVDSAEKWPDQMEDNTAYHPVGIQQVTNETTLGDPSPIIGSHGSLDGIIYEGGGTMINGTNAPLHLENCSFSAPGGTLFDVTGDGSTQTLIGGCNFSDFAGRGEFSSLGTLDSMKIPSIVKCNIGDFADGLTFDGSGEKIFIAQSPTRDVTQAGVDIFTLAATADYPEVDHVDSYVKSVQSDTTVWQVESGGEPSSVLQYRGVLHDDTFGGKDQAVAGALSTDSVGVRVSDSFPITDWAVNGDLDIDGAATIPSAGTVTEVVDGNFSGSQTFTLSEQVRTSKEANEGGRLQYDAKDNAITRVFLILSISASNTTVSVFIGKNGDDLERSQSQVETAGAGSPVTVPSTTNIRLNTGDYVSAYVRDDDGTADIEIETMALTLGPA